MEIPYLLANAKISKNAVKNIFTTDMAGDFTNVIESGT
jgi:hypothetical protein